MSGLNLKTIEELQGLINEMVYESQVLEYKAYNFPRGKVGDAKESIIKEIVAFANSSGGQLILGISESNGMPVELNGLGCNIASFSEIQNTISNYLSIKVRPKISGITFIPLETTQNQLVVIINVPKSLFGPHAFNNGTQDFFYIRHTSTTATMGIEELRSKFISSNDIYDKVRQFRKNRIAMIIDGESVGEIHDGLIVVVHVIPLWSFIEKNNIAFAELLRKIDLEIRFHGQSRYNLEGICKFSEFDNKVTEYLQIFREGMIEDVQTLDKSIGYVNWFKTEETIVDKFSIYIDKLKGIGIEGPTIFSISLLNCRGVYHSANGPGTYLRPRILKEVVFGIESYLTDNDVTIDSISPTLDSISNAFGLPKSQYSS